MVAPREPRRRTVQRCCGAHARRVLVVSGAGKTAGVSDWLVARTSRFLGDRLSRRSFIARATLVGTAVAATGCRVVIQPGSPYTFVTDCGGGALCRDGYTEFCCVINQGVNACPPGTAAAGWWRADHSVFCGGGARYYIDCNNWAGAGPCRCADGCGTRKVYCNHFRYGQCNQQFAGTGVIACRMVTCIPPYFLDIGCTPSGAVDNATAGHFADCARYLPPPPPPTSPPAVEPSLGTAVVPVAGSITVIARDATGSAAFLPFDGSGSGWGSWTPLPGLTTASKIAAVVSGADAVDVVAGGADGTNGGLWGARVVAGSASAWTPIGGLIRSDPAVALDGSEVLAFVRAPDDAIWYAAHTGGGAWTPLASLGGLLTSDPCAVNDASGLHVFARGTDRALWYRRRNGSSFDPWTSLAGILTSDISAVSDPTGLYTFVRGTDDALWFRRGQGGSWDPWTSLGGNLGSDPAAISAGSGLWVFIRGSDGVLYNRRLVGGTWTAWESVPGLSLTSDPEPLALVNDVAVFARGTDPGAALWQAQWSSGSWSSWVSLGGSLAPTRGAVSA